jgi:ABC-type amino acid transport substrate-binding protein
VKKSILLFVSLLVLVGCNSAEKRIDDAKEDAGKAVENAATEPETLKPDAKTEKENEKDQLKVKAAQEEIPEVTDNTLIVVGVHEGSDILSQKAISEVLQYAGVKQITYIGTESLSDSFKKIKNGEIDVAIDLEVGEGGHGYGYSISYYYDTQGMRSTGFATRKGTGIRHILDEGIRQFKKSDEYNELLTEGVEFEEVEKLKAKIQ